MMKKKIMKTLGAIALGAMYTFSSPGYVDAKPGDRWNTPTERGYISEDNLKNSLNPTYSSPLESEKNIQDKIAGEQQGENYSRNAEEEKHGLDWLKSNEQERKTPQKKKENPSLLKDWSVFLMYEKDDRYRSAFLKYDPAKSKTSLDKLMSSAEDKYNTPVVYSGLKETLDDIKNAKDMFWMNYKDKDKVKDGNGLRGLVLAYLLEKSSEDNNLIKHQNKEYIRSLVEDLLKKDSRSVYRTLANTTELDNLPTYEMIYKESLKIPQVTPEDTKIPEDEKTEPSDLDEALEMGDQKDEPKKLDEVEENDPRNQDLF